MSRRPSFRRDSELKNQIRKLNKNISNKKSRIRTNKGLEVEGVETVKYADFSSRREIEKYIKRMSGFLDKKANFGVMTENDVMMEYADVLDYEERIRKVNRNKATHWNKIKDLPFKHKGKPTGITVGQQADPIVGMGDARYSDFRDLNNRVHMFRSSEELKNRITRMDELYGDMDQFTRKKNHLLRSNYLAGMRDQGLDQLDRGRAVYEHIRRMGYDEFNRMFYTENNASISFLYDLTSQEGRIDELEKVWDLKNRPKQIGKKGA